MHRLLRNHCKLPAALSTTPMICHLPGTAWQKVWARPAGSTCMSSLWANTTPLVPSAALTTPVRTMPLPTAPAA